MASADLSNWRTANSMGPLHALHSFTQRGLAFWTLFYLRSSTECLRLKREADERHVPRRWTGTVKKANPPYQLLFNLETISVGVRRGCSEVLHSWTVSFLTDRSGSCDRSCSMYYIMPLTMPLSRQNSSDKRKTEEESCVFQELEVKYLFSKVNDNIVCLIYQQSATLKRTTDAIM
jgi:hypothetical protein